MSVCSECRLSPTMTTTTHHRDNGSNASSLFATGIPQRAWTSYLYTPPTSPTQGSCFVTRQDHEKLPHKKGGFTAFQQCSCVVVAMFVGTFPSLVVTTSWLLLMTADIVAVGCCCGCCCSLPLTPPRLPRLCLVHWEGCLCWGT